MVCLYYYGKLADFIGYEKEEGVLIRKRVNGDIVLEQYFEDYSEAEKWLYESVGDEDGQFLMA